MPVVHVAKLVNLNGDNFRFYRTAVLLKEGDTFVLYDPASDNDLARNMSPSFVKMLEEKRWLVRIEPENTSTIASTS